MLAISRTLLPLAWRRSRQIVPVRQNASSCCTRKPPAWQTRALDWQIASVCVPAGSSKPCRTETFQTRSNRIFVAVWRVRGELRQAWVHEIYREVLELATAREAHRLCQ